MESFWIMETKNVQADYKYTTDPDPSSLARHMHTWSKVITGEIWIYLCMKQQVPELEGPQPSPAVGDTNSCCQSF